MRQNRLVIILSDKERDRVIAEASREGLTLSAWARMMIKRALDNPNQIALLRSDDETKGEE